MRNAACLGALSLLAVLANHAEPGQRTTELVVVIDEEGQPRRERWELAEGRYAPQKALELIGGTLADPSSALSSILVWEEVGRFGESPYLRRLEALADAHGVVCNYWTRCLADYLRRRPSVRVPAGKSLLYMDIVWRDKERPVWLFGRGLSQDAALVLARRLLGRADRQHAALVLSNVENDAEWVSSFVSQASDIAGTHGVAFEYIGPAQGDPTRRRVSAELSGAGRSVVLPVRICRPSRPPVEKWEVLGRVYGPRGALEVIEAALASAERKHWVIAVDWASGPARAHAHLYEGDIVSPYRGALEALASRCGAVCDYDNSPVGWLPDEARETADWRILSVWVRAAERADGYVILGTALSAHKALALVDRALALPGSPYREVQCSASADQLLLPRTAAFLEKVGALAKRHGARCTGVSGAAAGTKPHE